MRKSMNVLSAVFAVLVAASPGIALAHGGGGGGNGTPNPPPSSPPCDADGHGGTPPPYGPGQGSPNPKQCSSSSSSSESSTSSETSSETSTETSSETSSQTSSETSSSTSSDTSSSTSTSTSSSTSGAEGICDSGGALPIPSETGGNETIGDAVADGIMGSPLGDLNGLIQDPGENGGFGPVSQPLSSAPAPVGTELACAVNVVYLQGGGGNLPNGL